jgi:hypothetical protein
MGLVVLEVGCRRKGGVEGEGFVMVVGRAGSETRERGGRGEAKRGEAAHLVRLVLQLHQVLLDAPQLLQVERVDVVGQLGHQRVDALRHGRHLALQAAWGGGGGGGG